MHNPTINVIYIIKLRVLDGTTTTSRKVAGSRPDEVNFFNLPNPTAALGPGVSSASNRNEYQKQKKNVSGE
jgi:hypothetical protein